MEEHEALQGIRRRSAASLLQEAAHTNALEDEAWEQVRQALRARSCGVLPSLLPPSSEAFLVVFPLDRSEFGPILEAARQVMETGTQQTAQELAQAARSVGALTTVPRLRHYRAGPPGASPRSRLDHRVGVEGGGFLAMPAVEALDALELGGRAPRPRDGVFPLPQGAAPGSWVVVRHGVHSAPGLVLTGVQAAYDDRAGGGAEQLMSYLRTAAAALRPAPARIEWGTDTPRSW
ncbi:hypothetical protein [Streptomyces sp. NPDC002685]|uniref:hypothetical protein n=1 Tax=Streptomyces sp. NPDC002685 TaxID=3154540 RepID=UPI003329E1C7